jgi:hypothetical protein
MSIFALDIYSKKKKSEDNAYDYMLMGEADSYGYTQTPNIRDI